MVTIQLLLASLFTLAMGNPLGRRSMQLHESRPEAPDGFVATGAAPADKVLTLRLSLAQSDPDGLTDALMTVSDPASAQYGQHLSQDQVRLFCKLSAPP